MLPTTDFTTRQQELMDLISLASAYRANLNTISSGLSNRFAADEIEITDTVDQIDLALLSLTRFINRKLSALNEI